MLFAVVITYQRPESLKETLENLISQTKPPDKVLVIDNSEDESWILENLKVIRSLKEVEFSDSKTHNEIFSRNQSVRTEHFKKSPTPIQHIALRKNLGSAGGYQLGIYKAFWQGAKKIFLSDDDTLYEKNALQNLAEKLDKLPDAGVVRCAWENYKGEIREVESSVWTGTMIKSEVVAKVGLPDHRFFLYADDEEYFWRIRKAGFKIYLVPEARYLKRPQEHKKTFKFLFFKTKTYKSSERIYYAVRNELFISLRFERKKLPKVLASFSKLAVSTFFSEPKHTLAFFEGAIDGIFGRLGRKG